MISSHHHSGGNTHRHQLLEEEFTCVRYSDLTYLGLILTSFTLERIVFQVSYDHHATQVTYVNPVCVRHFKESLVEEHRRAVSDDGITFHLAEPETTVT